jgi:metallo-beta-lactamase family protein
MKVTFLGGAGTVTGSCYLVEVGDRKILLDCGQFQGTRADEARNHDRLPVAIDRLDAVVLSHAHIDHSGRLPLLRKQKFHGPIYTHHASRALCEIMLADSAYLQEKDAEWENKRRRRKGLRTIEPLYTRADAQAVIGQFHGLEYGEEQRVAPGITVRLSDAGHILGAAIVELWLEESGQRRKVVFSGDLGFLHAPVMQDPARIAEADWVLMESTYGDRNHRSFDDTLAELKSIFLSAAAGRGNILIPAFAVGRTQDLLSLLAEHYEDWGIGRWRVYLDSPMAIETTEVYWRYRHLYRSSLFGDDQRIALPNLIAARSSQESMRINSVESGAIIIAGSGMCSGGRILHHLKHNLWRPQCHVIIIGFQANGTLGRRLVDGADQVRLWQETIRVNASIHTVGGLSAHADQSGLLDWYGGFANRPPVSLVHGESRAQEALASALRSRYAARVQIPSFGDELSLA